MYFSGFNNQDSCFGLSHYPTMSSLSLITNLFLYNLEMGNQLCPSPFGSNPTLVIPQFQEIRPLLKKKLSINLSRTTSTDLSLILPASKNTSASSIIRYYLLYVFYINKYKEKKEYQKKFQSYFIEIIQQSCKDLGEKAQNLLEQFINEYESLQNDQNKLNLLLLNYAFKSNFMLEHLNRILLSSDDPKALAYFIFPIYSFYYGISSNFRKPDINRKENLWIVAVLQNKEIQYLKKLENNENYFFFSVFMRGFTDNRCAKEQFANLRKDNKRNTFLFTVNFPYDHTKMRTEQNKGFFILKDASTQIKKKGDVLFNIITSFKLSTKTGDFEYDLDYGQLAQLTYKKEKDRFAGKEPILIRIFEVCRGTSKFYLKSQSWLCRMFADRKSAIDVSQTLIKSSLEINDIQRQNIVNTHIQNGQFEQALQAIGDSENLLFQAKKMQILFAQDKFQEVKAEIAKTNDRDLKDQKNFQARLIIDLLSARILLNNKQYNKAKSKLQPLYEVIVKAYPQDYEYIGRDVISGLVECDRKGKTGSNLEELVYEGAGSYSGIDQYIYRFKRK